MFDFPPNIRDRLTLDIHDGWKQYILSIGEYKLYIQMPNKYEHTVEIALNKGKKELMGGIILRQHEYDKIINLIENGGVYIQEKKRWFRNKPDVYIEGINMPDDIDKRAFTKIY